MHVITHRQPNTLQLRLSLRHAQTTFPVSQILWLSWLGRRKATLKTVVKQKLFIDKVLNLEIKWRGGGGGGDKTITEKGHWKLLKTMKYKRGLSHFRFKSKTKQNDKTYIHFHLSLQSKTKCKTKHPVRLTCLKRELARSVFKTVPRPTLGNASVLYSQSHS